jgi:hypothetical protein
MSPEQTVLLTNVLMGSGVLFVIAYLGNALTFSNRFLNALATALIFGVFYGVLIYTVDKTVTPPELKEASHQAWLQIVVMASSVVFVLDLVANFISFNNRAVSALVTAVLFAVLFGFAIYSSGGLMHGPVSTGPLGP